MNDPNAWFLVDSVSDPGEWLLCLIVNVASPNRSNFKQFEKYPNSDTLYMPPWSLQESLKCSKYHPMIPDQVVKDRFEKFGGVPRQIFSGRVDLDFFLEEKLGKYVILNCFFFFFFLLL